MKSIRMAPSQALLAVCLLWGAAGQHAAMAQTFSNEAAWDDGTNFHYEATYTGSYPNFNVYLDTDCNAATGYSFYSIGADYLIENTALSKSTANGSAWDWSGLSAAVTETVPASGTIEFSVPVSAIGNPVEAYVMFQVLTSGWVGTADPHVITYWGVPSAPTSLTATAGSGQVSLNWTASPGASSYNIYRGTSSGGESSTAVATGVTGTSYNNTGLTNGTKYYYKITASNGSGTSGYSSEASATPAAVTGTSYYVSTSGSDSNSGSSSSPWLTPQHAANTVGPGATVYLESGTYAPFNVNVSGSSSGGYITFTNYPGETATIDGTGWTASYDQGLIEIQNENYITISGLNIQNGSSTSNTSSPVGVMVVGSGSHIQILNNLIHNITNTASSNGNAHGILVRGNSSTADIDNVTISGNQVYSLETGWSESVTLAGDVNTFTVSNNTIHDNNNIGLDLQGGYGTSPLVDQARNGEVSGNLVYNCSTLHNSYYSADSCAGLYVDGGTAIVMERNTVHNCDYGVDASSETTGKVSSYVTVRSNLIYSNAANGIIIGGYNSGSTGGTQNCTFVNNTLYGDDTNDWWCGEIGVRWRSTGNVFENNILYALSQNVFVKDTADDSSSIGTFDYNDYYSTGGASNSNWQWSNETSWLVSFSTWQSYTGQDAHSVYSNPLFVSLTTPNFNLSTGSPALDSGNYGLGSSDYGALDFAGNARTIGSTIDMGAYED